MQVQLILDKLTNITKIRNIDKNGRKRKKISKTRRESASKDPQKAMAKGEQNKLIEEFLKPLDYKGHKIASYKDLLGHVDLDVRDDIAKFAGEFQKDQHSKEAYREATEAFTKILDDLRPQNIDAAKMGAGDWYIYLERVNKNKFSIEEHAKKRKQEFEMIAHEQAKQDMQAMRAKQEMQAMLAKGV